MARRVFLLATVETKGEEVGYLADALRAGGLEPEICDISLNSGGACWAPDRKLGAMEAAAGRVLADLMARLGDAVAAVGMGGGTGGEVILSIMRGLPMAFPKFLVTTLPFDPRAALADTAITLVPTLADIGGLNASLKQILDNTAAMVAGLAAAPPRAAIAPLRAVGVTALGVTEAARHHLVDGLTAAGHEAIVFHANGFGGAAFARFAREGAFRAIIDMTVHEITRLEIAGSHAPMPDRFSAASDVPRVVLPGGINFLGLGEVRQVGEAHLARPHYRHSGFFTHVALSDDEAGLVAARLAAHLNRCAGPVAVILPMGGFSSEDRPGGCLENPRLREIVAETLERDARHYSVARIPHHINAPETARAALDALRPLLKD